MISRNTQALSTAIPLSFIFVGIHWGQFPEFWEITDKKEIKGSLSSGINSKRENT